MKVKTLKHRLLGQETEYALRFTPEPGSERPDNSFLFEAFRRGIKKLVKTVPGERKNLQEQFFIENGGAFCYEHQPFAPRGGLLEGATPECRGPSELLLYQRAQEILLVKAIPFARKFLEKNGYVGELGLIKNCRDHKGNIYGAQENYEAILSRGFSLFLYRAGLLLFFPLIFFTQLFYWLFFFVLLFALLLGGLFLWGTAELLRLGFSLFANLIRWKPLRRAARKLKFARDRRVDSFLNSWEDGRMETFLGKLEFRLIYPVWLAILFPQNLLLRLFAFRSQRKALESFFISRAVFAGAGTLLEDGSFALSEKGVAIKKLTRLSVGPYERALFDSGNLLKALLIAAQGFLLFRFKSLKRLLAPVQRLQVGMSESNRSQFAEYLKVGVTFLLLDLAEAGELSDAPRLKRPIRALRAFIHDPGLKARARLRGPRPDASALELQRWYLVRARESLARRKDFPLEYGEILKLWEKTLDALEKDPGSLIGRVDWVSKLYLLKTSGEGEDFATRKKIDIGYHELGSGFFQKLEDEGLSPVLVSEKEAEEAVRAPASSRGARLRSRLIKELTFQGKRVAISWDSVRLGSFFNRRVVSLDEYRKKREGVQ